MIPREYLLSSFRSLINSGGMEDPPELLTIRRARNRGFALAPGFTITAKNVKLPRFFWTDIKSTCVLWAEKPFRSQKTALRYLTKKLSGKPSGGE